MVELLDTRSLSMGPYYWSWNASFVGVYSVSLMTTIFQTGH